MRINLTKLSFYLLGGIFCVSVVSCVDAEKERQEVVAAEFEQAEKELMSGIDKVLHDLPSPAEVPYTLQATGADFRAEFVNPLTGVDQYLTSNDKSALNLGVYATDIGYYSSYGQSQEALKYVEACQKLAEKIGVASAFDMKLMSRFEQNIGNNDSLAALIQDAMVMAEVKLEESDRLTMAALILSGSFIEGLYISTKVIEDYPKDQLSEANRDLILEPLMRVVLDQKTALLDLISVLKHTQQDEIITYLIVEMNVLRYQYDELQELADKINSNTGGVVLHQHDLRDITAEIKRIRQDITS